MANDCNDLNNVAMYYSICEYLAEFAEMTYEEEMPDELWEYLVKRAFQYEGVDNIDVKAVGKLFNECMAAGEQLADLQGYAIPSGYPFDDWVEEFYSQFK